MPRSVGSAHVVRQADGSSIGLWGVHTLRTAFQPIFTFQAGRLNATAYEGLLRPLREGLDVSPAAFFAAVPEVDRGHVESLARTLHLLNAGSTLDPAALVFINFDPSQFAEPEDVEVAVRDMRLTLHEAKMQAGRVVCEITEQASHSAMLMRLVAALREAGCRVAVDDYGAEDSDMARIRTLHPDIVKFDGAWVAELMRSDPGFGLLFEMVRRFREMGVDTLFEGIEEGWQLDLAERAGVSMVQGYALARPQLAPADFRAFATTTPATDPTGRPQQDIVQPAAPAASRARAFGRRTRR